MRRLVMKIVVIGGTGFIGSKVVKRSASPQPKAVAAASKGNP